MDYHRFHFALSSKVTMQVYSVGRHASGQIRLVTSSKNGYLIVVLQQNDLKSQEWCITWDGQGSFKKQQRTVEFHLHTRSAGSLDLQKKRLIFLPPNGPNVIAGERSQKEFTTPWTFQAYFSLNFRPISYRFPIQNKNCCSLTEGFNGRDS